MKITALSSLCADIYPNLEQFYVGGNSLNFATQCRHSGLVDVSIIGAVGNDDFGLHIEQHLDKYGINRTYLYRVDAPTASNRIYINEQGDRYFRADSWQGGAFDAFRLSENDWKFLRESDIIAMPAGDPNLKDLLERRTKQQLVVVDFLDYLGIDFIKKYIDRIDVVFLSAKQEMISELQQLSVASGKLIVATLGSAGSISFQSHKSYYQQALPVDEIVDTTGCGDAFQAAFAIEWRRTANLTQALYKGAMAAKHVLGFKGGVP